jgi:ABC-type uncharacterized transport system involved in gliding motility auxiliary subunit
MTSITTSKWKEGSFLTALTLVFLAILIGLTLIIHRFPLRWDVTEGQRHSISPQSQRIVKSINRDVLIRAFFQEGNPAKKKAQALLDTYVYSNPRLRYTFIDPDRQPAQAQQFGVRNYGTLVLESGGKTRNVSSADEEGITGGLLRLMQNKVKKVVFATGHGEKSPNETQRQGYSLAKGLLEKENYRVEEVNLLAGGLPPETACLVIAGPRKPFFGEELQDLKNYLAGGGSLILLLEPFQDGGLTEWLKSYGVTLSNDILIDKVSRLFGGDYLIPMAGSYGQHPITEKFTVATFYPSARSLSLSSPLPPGLRSDVLVRSSSGSWAETNKTKVEKGEATFDAGQDRQGPLTIAVLLTLNAPGNQAQPLGSAEKEQKPLKGRLAVFGDSDFAGNGTFNLSGNGDLFLNTVNFLTEEEQLIAIRPAKTPVKPLSLTAAQAKVLFWVPLVLLPLLIVTAGLAVWKKRSRAR